MFLLTQVTGDYDDTYYNSIFVSKDEQKIKDKIIELKIEDMKQHNICKKLSDFIETSTSFLTVMGLESDYIDSLSPDVYNLLYTQYDSRYELLIKNFLLEQGIPEEEHNRYSIYNEVPFYRISEVVEI